MADAASVVSEDESFKEFRDNGLVLAGPPPPPPPLAPAGAGAGLECVGDYGPGGHHPVHLGDVLNGRYAVLHKLSSGASANTWLCHDLGPGQGPRYRAVSLLAADAATSAVDDALARLAGRGLGGGRLARHFGLPSARFVLDGPNGRHVGLVYDGVFGPSVARLPRAAGWCADEAAGRRLRALCLQVTQAVALLHAQGICHGDIGPANILCSISNLDSLAEADLVALLGPPQTTPVRARGRADSDSPHAQPTAPQYLVSPVSWSAAVLSTTSMTACLVGWAESFSMADPPESLDAAPLAYCAPAYVLHKKVGEGTDLWALGCALVEMRTGRSLFGHGDGDHDGDGDDDDPDRHLARVAGALGRFPEPWWSVTWDARSRFFAHSWDGAGPGAVLQPNETTEPIEVLVRRKLGQWADEVPGAGIGAGAGAGAGAMGALCLDKEAGLLADLLRTIMSYSPEPQSSAMEALNHAWFYL